MTRNVDGPSWGCGPALGTGPSLSQTSSSPKATRVGAPVADVCVGSGWIHSLYQDCTPGSYDTALPAGSSEEPLVWSLVSTFELSISVQC